MKKKGFFLLVVMVLALCLTACGGTRGLPGENASVTLTVMGRKSDVEKSYMTNIFQQYERETGNHLEILSFEDSEFETRAVEEFEKGNVPDIFLHFNNADLKRFDVQEHFDFLNDAAWVSDLTDSAKAYCQDEEGNLLGLPFWESSVSGCYYNKTLLDQLGLQPATTQAEFDALCQAIADKGYTPICWPGNGCTWMFQFGLDPVFADDTPYLEKLNKNESTYADVPGVTDMVQWIHDAAEKGWFGPDFQKTGWSDISKELNSGKAVMTFIWDTWFYTDFKKGDYGIDDFALMPVFMNTVDTGTYEGGNLNMMMVNKNSSRKETALEFLAYCATPENYNIAFDGISTVSCFNGQTTNIQSKMVTDAKKSLDANERVSTAATRIIGYSADDVAAAFDSLFEGKTNVDGCVQLMDEYRILKAQSQGAPGF